jgi:hypothetical protein
LPVSFPFALGTASRCVVLSVTAGAEEGKRQGQPYSLGKQ